ncbi:MAG: hypothetical protein UV79_C0019G0006 [candidate division TM6 bacterium GW2011_GWF2_43_17]|nr:MAG: hypothetical protein UV79_C0019G0006 [candidate division TM6 bacterium GW2011_GWF2_43_17]
MTQKKELLCPQQIVIAIDLHGVLFTFNYAKLLTLVTSIAIVTLSSYYYMNAAVAVILGLATLAPVLFVTLASGYFALSHGYRPVVEHHILSSKTPPIPLIKKGWLWISNFFYPRASLVSLCWELKKTGHQLILLSDIGPEAFEILKDRYPKTFQRNNVNLFTHTYYPNSSDSKDILLTPWYPKNAHNFFKKFAHAFLHKYPQIKKIIFIDNSKKNIKRAQRQGGHAFITIHFSNTRKTKAVLKSRLHPK